MMRVRSCAAGSAIKGGNMPDHNEAMRLADEVRVVADRLQYTPGGFYGVETVGPIN